MKGTTKFLVATLIMSSVVFSVECKNWWTMWMLLEINSFLFLIYMIKELKKEKVFIFFIYQTISSMLMMVFIFYNSWMTEENYFKNMNKILLVSIFLKIGMFPLHNWLLSISKNMSWMSLMLLFSWQKAIPIMVMMKMKFKENLFLILCSAMIITGILMTKLTQSKVILTASSLMHNSLMFIPVGIFKMLTVFYLTSYSLMVVPLMKIFQKNFFEKISNQLKNKKPMKKLIELMISLSGIPPTMGFILKMMVVFFLLKMSALPSMMMMIFLSACVSFYVYFSLFMKSFCMNTKKTLNKIEKEKQNLKITKLYFMMPIVVWI